MRFEIAIDAVDPELLRPFWAAALEYVPHTTAEGAIDLVDPSGHRPTVWFQQVPEAKTMKNRLHLDIFVRPGERAGRVSELVKLGGKVLTVYEGFTVLGDPEGNELCLTDSAATGWATGQACARTSRRPDGPAGHHGFGSAAMSPLERADQVVAIVENGRCRTMSRFASGAASRCAHARCGGRLDARERGDEDLAGLRRSVSSRMAGRCRRQGSVPSAHPVT